MKEVTIDKTVLYVHFYDMHTNCSTVQCTTLPSPSNGNISCDFTSAPRYEDQCSFLCDPGYELTGSSTRQCLSNGSWSGTDVTWVFTGSGVTCSPGNNELHSVI